MKTKASFDREARRVHGAAVALAALVAVRLLSGAPAHALYLDEDRDLSVRLRAYTQTSMATQHYEVQSDPPTGVGQIVSQRNFFNPEFDAKFPGGPSSRPDFAGIIYPGPSPYAAPRPNAKQLPPPAVPKDVPPSFSACPGSGDRVHAVWALEYYSTMLAQSVPNIELHLYGRGTHGGGGTDRGGTPLGTWQLRFIEWFRDLGFLGKPGEETRAARDVAAWAAKR